MEHEIGYQPATKQTWKGDPIRLAVLRLRNEHPRASRQDINKYLAEAAREDDDLLVAIATYAGDLTQNAIEDDERRKRRREQEQERRSSEKAEKAEQQIQQAAEKIVARVLYLNELMPNGKRMRHCTGGEMIAMGREHQDVGRKWCKIGEKTGKTKAVGQVLDEKAIKALMER
jgi:hypothetical protein